MDFDAIVIGSGQAGNPLSQKLADLGWHVALVERGPLGGTCINTGCTPTKTMVASAQVAHYARNAARWGVRAANVSVDLPAIVARKNQVVEHSRSGQERNVAKRKTPASTAGQAQFTGPHTVEVAGESLASQKSLSTSARAPPFLAFRGSTQRATSPTHRSWSCNRSPNISSFSAAGTSASNLARCSPVSAAALPLSTVASQILVA